jgi:protein TonB
VVIVNVEVDADGRAADVSLSRSSGFPLLDQAALEAVRRWTFEPAREGGFPVASRVDVPVRFSLAR